MAEIHDPVTGRGGESAKIALCEAEGIGTCASGQKIARRPADQYVRTALTQKAVFSRAA